MDLETIKNIAQTRGYAALTTAQKEMLNNPPATMVDTRTASNQLSDAEIDTLAKQGYTEGMNVPGKGILTPEGTFRSATVTTPTTTQANMSVGYMNQQKGLNPDGTPIVPSQETPGTQPATPGIGSSIGDLYKELAGAESERASITYDPEAARQEALRRLQAEIDAQNAYFDQQAALVRAQQQKLGQGRLGSEGAAQARAGMLGSTFGQAQTARTAQENADLEQAAVNIVEAQRRDAIAALKKEAITSALADAKAVYDTKLTAAENKIKDITSRAERKKTSTATLASKLAAIGDYQESDIKREVDDFNRQNAGAGFIVDASEVLAQFKELKKTQAEDAAKALAAAEKAKRDSYINVSEGTTVFDPATGKPIYTAPKTYKPEGDTGASTPGIANQSVERALRAVTEAEKYSDASGDTGILGKAGRFFTGTDDYTNLTAQSNTLRTLIMTLRTDPNTKKFFGPAMSNADVQFMMSGGTTLNPELQTPEAFKIELESVKRALNEMKKTGNIPGATASAPSDNSDAIISAGGVMQKNGLFLMPDGSLVDPTK